MSTNDKALEKARRTRDAALEAFNACDGNDEHEEERLYDALVESELALADLEDKP